MNRRRREISMEWESEGKNGNVRLYYLWCIQCIFEKLGKCSILRIGKERVKIWVFGILIKMKSRWCVKGIGGIWDVGEAIAENESCIMKINI